MPVFDFHRFDYEAVVKHPFRLPVYSAPHGCGGHKVGISYLAGDSIQILDEIKVSRTYDGTYVSALCPRGWINLWTLHNKNGSPVGVDFVKLLAHSTY